MDGSDFPFDYMIDVIEEDALNRKYCGEVLRKLISRADAEIEELEGELFVLETQIEWAEHDKYTDLFDLCSKALGEKTNSLKLSICSLKNQNNHNDENDIALQSQMDAKPVMKIHEIIKALLSNKFLDKDGLLADVIVIEDAPDAQDHPVSQSDLKQNFDQTVYGMQADFIPDGSDALQGSLIQFQSDPEENSDLIYTSPMEKEQVKEANVAPKDDSHNLDSSSKPENMTVDQPEKVSFLEVDAANTTNTDGLKSALMLPVKKEIDTTEPEQVEVQVPRIPATCKVVGLKSSLKLQMQRARDEILAEKVTVQNATVSNTINSDSIRSTFMLQRQGEMKLQRQREKDKIQPEKIKAQKTDATNTAASEGLKSCPVSQRQKKKRMPEVKDVQQASSSATGKASTSKSPLKLQSKLKRDISKLDKFKGEEVGLADTINDEKLKLNHILQRQQEKSMAQSEQGDVHEPCVSPNDNIETSSNLRRQRLQNITQSSTVKVQKPDGGSATILYSSTGSEQNRAKLERYVIQSDPMALQFGVANLSENVVQSNKGGRKRHNQEGVLISNSTANNSSKCPTFKKKRPRKLILSSSDEAEELSETSTYNHCRVEAIFKLVNDEMSVKSSKAVMEMRDEPQKSLCYLEPTKLPDFGDLQNETSAAFVGLGPNELSQMTLLQLRSVAKARGLKGFSKHKKEGLIQYLTEPKLD